MPQDTSQWKTQILNLKYTLLHANAEKVKYCKLDFPDEELFACDWQPCEEKVTAHCVPSTVLPNIRNHLNALSQYQ